MGRQQFDVVERYLEIAVLTVSKLNECRYCVAHHAPRLVETGLPIETAMNILEPDCPGFDEVDRLVRDYAVQVTTDSKRVSDAMFAALRELMTRIAYASNKDRRFSGRRHGVPPV